MTTKQRFLVYGNTSLGALATWRTNLAAGLSAAKHEVVHANADGSLPTSADVDYILCFTHPNGLVGLFHPPEDTVLFTYWEGDAIPKEIVEKLRPFRAIVVPGSATKKVFEAHGLNAIALPIGVNPAVFYEDRLPHGKPKFYASGEWTPTSGLHEIIAAYLEEFKNNEAELFIRTWSTVGLTQLDFNEFVTFVRQKTESQGIVYIVSNMYTPTEMNDILNNCDAVVSAAKTGTGAVILEAMAAGLPPIVPQGGDWEDYLAGAWKGAGRAVGGYPWLYPSLREPAPKWADAAGNVLKANLEVLRKKMRYAIEHRKEMHDLGHQAHLRSERFTIDRVAERFLKEVKPHERPKKPEAEPPKEASTPAA